MEPSGSNANQMQPADASPVRGPKVLLLGASLATNNMGVGALTVSAIRCILHGIPDAEVCLLDYGRESAVYSVPMRQGSVSVRLINLRFSKKVYLPNHIALLLTRVLASRLLPMRSVRRALISSNPWLREVDEASVCASIAGGDSFSDIYGLTRFFYVSLPQFLVLLMGKKLTLLPQTIGPFRTRIARFFAGQILRRADTVYSRDQAGMRDALAVAGGLPEGRVRFCYDMGFVLEPVAPAQSDSVSWPTGAAAKRNPVIGLNVSGLLYMGGYNRKNMFGLRLDYPALVEALIEHLIRGLDASVLLVPHVFGSETHAESDSIVCAQLFEKLKSRYAGRIGLVRGSHNQSEIKSVIGRCDFFVGSRMHACIAALSQNVPAVAIAYSQKFKGVMETLGIPSLVADLRSMNQEEVIQQITENFEAREQIQQQLRERMPAVQQTVLSLFAGSVARGNA